MGTAQLVVPFFSFQAAPSELRRQWQSAIDQVIREGVMIGGRLVADFEQQWAARVGVAGCVGVANGLDALTLSLRALGIGPGHRVALPAHTFIATWLSVRAVGAEPVGVDVQGDGQLDLDMLEQLPSDIDAVIPVHMHGATVDMPRLMSWADLNGIRVIEDCAQAHGAIVGGRPVGSWGHAAAFSFYPTKNLGALGDAGAVVSNDTDLLERVRTYGNYGASPEDKYVHVVSGVNSRLDPMQAAILSVNLQYLDRWNHRRALIATELLETVRSLPSLGTPLPLTPEASVWHHFVLMANDRDRIRTTLREKGIGTEIHYPRLAAEEMASIQGDSPSGTGFATAHRFAKQGLSLPLHQWMSDADVSAVKTALRESL